MLVHKRRQALRSLKFVVLLREGRKLPKIVTITCGAVGW